jgi:hypothetical protein
VKLLAKRLTLTETGRLGDKDAKREGNPPKSLYPLSPKQDINGINGFLMQI